jgi:hypothetical protein
MGISIRGKQGFRSIAFNRGQNSSGEPTTLPNGYAALIENGIIDDVGKVKQRNGISKIGDNPAELKLAINCNGNTITDSSASTQTIVYDTVSFTAGKFGDAVKMGGTGANITVAAHSTINVTSMGPFRFSCYVKGTAGTIANKWDTHKGFSIVVASGDITFKVGANATDGTIVTTNAALSATTFKRLTVA